MQIDHDTAWALEVLVLLVNSDDRRTGEDSLATPSALAGFVVEHRVSGSVTGAEAELGAVRRLRSQLREIFELAAAGDGASAVTAVNTLIAASGTVPRLVEHDGEPLHLHFTPWDAPLERRLGAEMSIALAIVIRDGGTERLRVCEAPACGRVLVDVSKNRSRRYCDTQCANRQHVAAYRRRRSAGTVLTAGPGTRHS